MQEHVQGLLQNAVRDNGIMDKAVRFVLKNQLKDRALWKRFTEVFTTHEDTENTRWRGEYFGKQMRGAVMIYAYTRDEELYGILTETVSDLLARQDEYGRFSTYDVSAEFSGWDIWCRKYVLVGLLYYYEICKDEALRTRVLTACKKHLDYIVALIGSAPNQKAITETSSWWGCVNSCTILEPTVELYKKTGDEAYLQFARYILSTGGSADCNLIELALEGKLCPYQYPVTKAYEMMSFYEGLLAYYEVTKEEKYFLAASKFVEAVAESDITIIGCAGCLHELFDHSATTQTEYSENIMQETCVTVTWMRLQRRLFDLTKAAKYLERMEISAYNALYGSLNTEMNKQFCMETNSWVEGMAFDSYSPLCKNTRGRGIGGYNAFATGGYCGCCIAIGACGVALFPLTAVVQTEGVVYVNFLFDGVAQVQGDDGEAVKLCFEGGYSTNEKTTIVVERACSLRLRIRKPNWCETMTVNGVAVAEEFFALERDFSAGERIDIVTETRLKTHKRNGKIAFTYGALTLAADEQKSDRDLELPVAVGEHPTYTTLPPQEGELLRFKLDLEDGTELLLTDYQSCGKKWTEAKSRISVWSDCL